MSNCFKIFLLSHLHIFSLIDNIDITTWDIFPFPKVKCSNLNKSYETQKVSFPFVKKCYANAFLKTPSHSERILKDCDKNVIYVIYKIM